MAPSPPYESLRAGPGTKTGGRRPYLDAVRCPALSAGMALERLAGSDAGSVRWSWRYRGADQPRPRIEQDG